MACAPGATSAADELQVLGNRAGIGQGHDRAGLNVNCQQAPLVIRQDRRLALRLARPQRFGPTRIEPQNPVADDLKANTASSRSPRA